MGDQIESKVRNRPMLPDGCLEGRAVLVTGGGTGLGRAMALGLAGLGARVAVAGRRQEPLDETVAEIGERGFAVTCDVREHDQVAAAFRTAEEALGPVTTLVNNAAGNFVVPAEELTPNGWRAVVGIVLDGTFLCSREFARRRIDVGGGGEIVNMVATYAWTGGPGTVHSAAAKAGVVNLTRTLAVEWARHGIRVNALCPGPVDTPQAAEKLWPTHETRDALLAKIPLRRFGRPEEVVDACAFLVSDFAGYVTGEVLTIDGGAWLEKGMFG
jgi:NAD(P)-dependent dehydrogenase (short-subunit alcohol dehydrogenase family)